ncbi:hypothetical protein SAMN05878482_105427 [Peribacillus simplex]|uniref:Uncharacterized protein n=1 Tax=Peribacillus simplex TaxID=1478 RepID=A0A9X8WLU9_9BACI|nr:hypothetical protein SAMN05878482_105427 [Peribacillus simplex]
MLFGSGKKESVFSLYDFAEEGRNLSKCHRTCTCVRMLWTKLTTSKKLILSQNSPETPEALNILNELVEVGKLKVVIDR